MLKWRYKFTAADYVHLLIKQGGHCALCPARPTIREPYLCVDHIHGTKTVRGLLCGKCNKGLGMLRDTPNGLARAFHYVSAVPR